MDLKARDLLFIDDQIVHLIENTCLDWADDGLMGNKTFANNPSAGEGDPARCGDRDLTTILWNEDQVINPIFICIKDLRAHARNGGRVDRVREILWRVDEEVIDADPVDID